MNKKDISGMTPYQQLHMTVPCDHHCGIHQPNCQPRIQIIKGGHQTKSFDGFFCKVVVSVSTTGVDDGAHSKHIINLEFENEGHIDVVAASRYGLRITAKGDDEAFTLQQAFQFLSNFFAGHGFHDDFRG